jgi:hypothetical protein
MAGGKPGKARVEPGWFEKSRAGEHRPGGGFMPYLDKDRNTMSMKQFADNRRNYETQIKTLKSDPGVFKPKA